jgi:predicted metal-binding protein
MSKSANLILPSDPPVTRALVFVCEKCGRRADRDGKNPSHRLASKFKRAAKRHFEHGEVRVALTTCMDLCPDDRIAVLVQGTAGAMSARFVTSDADDVDAASERLIKLIERDTPDRL